MTMKWNGKIANNGNQLLKTETTESLSRSMMQLFKSKLGTLAASGIVQLAV